MRDILIFTNCSRILFVLCGRISPEQNQKIKKVESLVHGFFYKEWTSDHRFWDWSSPVSLALHKACWLGWFCVLYMLLLYNTVLFVKKWAGRAVTYPQIRGYIEIICVHRSSKSTSLFTNKISVSARSMQYCWALICWFWLTSFFSLFYHHGRHYVAGVFFLVSASISLNSLDNTVLTDRISARSSKFSLRKYSCHIYLII